MTAAGLTSVSTPPKGELQQQSSSSTATTACTPSPRLKQKLGGYDFYKSIGSPKWVVAPMVDQSELAWRLLSKAPLPSDLAGPSTSVTGVSPDGTSVVYPRHQGGAHLTYTPMIHAKVFASSRTDSRGGDGQFNKTCGEEGSADVLAGIQGGDRPLFVQFCANDPELLLAAAKKIEDRCDAVDINFGCPQGIARRGHYGSYLQDEWELVRNLISTLHENLSVPVTAKFRIFANDIEKTVAYAKMMEAAGAQILTCHGRTREMKGQLTGLADWQAIKAVKEAVNVPVFANGNILYREDVDRCLAITGCDGVMTAEGNLSNPAIFLPPDHAHAYPSSILLAQRYLDIVESLETKTSPSAVKAHIFRLLKPILDEHEDLRILVGTTSMSPDRGIADYRATINTIAARVNPPALSVSAPPIDSVTGYRKLPSWVAQPYIRAKPVSSEVGGREEFVDGDPSASASASAGPSRAASPLPLLLPSAADKNVTARCVDESCAALAAARCPLTACLIHCRQIRAMEGGMDPAEAISAAVNGGLVGMGCEAHEAKVVARQKRQLERKETQLEFKKAKKARKQEHVARRAQERAIAHAAARANRTDADGKPRHGNEGTAGTAVAAAAAGAATSASSIEATDEVMVEAGDE